MINYTMIPNEEIYSTLAELYYKKSTAYKKRKKKLVMMSLMSLVLVAMSLWGTALSGGEEGYWFVFLILGVFIFCYGFYMILYGAKKQVMNAIRQKSRKEGISETTYILGEDIQVRTEKTEGRISWDLIEEIGEIRHFIYLWCSGSAIFLDKNRLSEEELSELSVLFKENA